MRKLGLKKYIREDLNTMLVEPSQVASQQAQKLGLQYVGFGRYEDPATGQVTHMVQNDELVPFSSAVRTNSYKEQGSDDFGQAGQHFVDKSDAVAGILKNVYTPNLFDNDELDAIASFTTDPTAINSKLATLPYGAPADRIQPDFDGDTTPKTIQFLDKAVTKAKVGVSFEVYTSLGQDVDPNQFAIGQTFRFKTFKSTSIDPTVVINSGTMNPGETKRTVYILQITLKENAYGLYADDYSSSPGEGEFILPRGTTLVVTEGANKIVGSSAMFNINNMEVYYITCETT